jgi:hypothetical protein
MNAYTPRIVRPYADDYRIGPRVCARIALDLRTKYLRRDAETLLSTEYQPHDWLAMWTREFHRDRAEYDRARAILETAQ